MIWEYILTMWIGIDQCYLITSILLGLVKLHQGVYVVKPFDASGPKMAWQLNPYAAGG